MRSALRSWRRRRWQIAAGGGAAVVAIVVVILAAGSSSPRAPAHLVESIFQDDQLLVYSPPATVAATLDTLRGLGVDRIRVTVLWMALAPDPASRTPPRGFRAADPADYPAAGWARYDRLVTLAAAREIGVDFNITAPGPLWAMGRPAPSATADHYRPFARAFGRFVAAVGRRYDGRYAVAVARTERRVRLPRVSYWTVWNEPNQPGWLAPQWRSARASRTGLAERVPDSPRLYRALLDAAWSALLRTGHRPATDTILIGELAPEGAETTKANSAIPPLPFVRALYCVDGGYRPLRGAGAGALGCPAAGDPHAFAAAHPGLFGASGFAHHPYAFFLSPSATYSDPNFVPLSELSHLEHALDAIFAAYGVSRTLPLYLTEYGYETDPPDPFRGVSPQKQAQYIDQAQYMAWRDPRVRALAQFLLVDSRPDRSFAPGTLGYWSTFQTGLEYLGGAHKPSFAAYRLPIFIPQPQFASGSAVVVWGMLRLAPNDTRQRAAIQWRPARGGAFRAVATVSTADPVGAFATRVSLPGSGTVRVAWTGPGGRAVYSRGARVVERR